MNTRDRGGKPTEPVPLKGCKEGLLRSGDGERGLIKGESSCAASSDWTSSELGYPLGVTFLGI